MSRTHDNEKKPSQSTFSFKPTASFLQTRGFAPLQTDLDEDAPRRSGYTENLLEKIINQRGTESADTPVQAKPRDPLRAIAKERRLLQAKLNIGEPNDKYEKEADDTAAKVVQQINSPNNPPVNSFIQDRPVQRQELGERQKLQMKPMKPLLQRRKDIAKGEASSDLESSIQSARGRGQSLDKKLQQSMGQAMGADFSNVKVHTDSQSDQLNKSIQAKAFTTGQDVFFRQRAYDPNSRGGQELIAHELTHVVQQGQHKKKEENIRPPHNPESIDRKVVVNSVSEQVDMNTIQRGKTTKIDLTEGDKENNGYPEYEEGTMETIEGKNKKVKDHILVRGVENGRYIFGVKAVTSKNTYNKYAKPTTGYQIGSMGLLGGNRPSGKTNIESLSKEVNEETNQTYKLVSSSVTEVENSDGMHRYYGLVGPNDDAPVSIRWRAIENLYLWEVSITEIMQELEIKQNQDVGGALLEIFKRDFQDMKVENDYKEWQEIFQSWHTHKFLAAQIINDIDEFHKAKRDMEKRIYSAKEKITMEEIEKENAKRLTYQGNIEMEAEQAILDQTTKNSTYQAYVRNKTREDKMDIEDKYNFQYDIHPNAYGKFKQ